jgi:pilus assembly protein CpaB
MRRRVLGILLAVALAGLGTWALVAYVQSAKDEALAEEPQVEVYVVTRDVRLGAGMREITESVELMEVPERLAAPDAVTDLDDLAKGDVTAVQLRAGEQLLESRLVDPDTLVRVEVPDGLQELTLALEPERAVGGLLEAGDLVGVVLSFDPFEITEAGAPAAVDDETTGGGDGDTDDGGEGAADGDSTPAKTPNVTHLTLHQVQVTSVRYAQRDSERIVERQSDDEEDADASALGREVEDEETVSAIVDEGPDERLLVTLAVSSPEVEQIVFAAEFGHVWLTKQTTETDEDGTRIVTLDQVYIVVPRP